jgi:hypothetical protein
MAITLINTVGANSGSLSFTGLGLKENDLLILGYVSTHTADLDTTVAGYTKVIDLHSVDSAHINLQVFWKRVGEIPDTGLSLPTSGAMVRCNVSVWRGVDTTTVLDVPASTATGVNSPNYDPPAITPVTPGARVLQFSAVSDATVYSSSSDFPFNYVFLTGTQFDGIGRYSFTGLSMHCRFASHGNWVAGEVDPPQVFSDYAASDYSWASAMIALRPAPDLGGQIKVWNGSAWAEKSVKVWNGSAWVTKPAKVWNGSAWVLA